MNSMSLRWFRVDSNLGKQEGNAPPAARLNLVSTWSRGASFTASAQSPEMADCVAKVFWAFRREILIQGQAGMRNNDSKEPALRFDSCKFLFHRARLATFATLSAKTGRERVQQWIHQKADYSITSSASASRVGGISTPSAFAVARLMTSSNLVPSSTGSSPGFSPLSIRPT